VIHSSSYTASFYPRSIVLKIHNAFSYMHPYMCIHTYVVWRCLSWLRFAQQRGHKQLKKKKTQIFYSNLESGSCFRSPSYIVWVFQGSWSSYPSYSLPFGVIPVGPLSVSFLPSEVLCFWGIWAFQWLSFGLWSHAPWDLVFTLMLPSPVSPSC
jgi:hypothetical protein